MSYLMDNEQITTPVKKRDHRGEKNPHFGHVMKPKYEADTQITGNVTLYAYYKKAIANVMTEDRVREIITETIRDYFNRNAIETKNNRPNNIPL